MSTQPESPRRPSPREGGEAADPPQGGGLDDFQELFNHLPDLAWVFDKESFAILAVNDAAVRRYGWSREELLAMSMLDIRPESDRQKFLALTESFPPTRELRGETRHWTKDHEEFVVDVDARDLRFQGKPCRFVTSRDAFERKMAWTALQEAQDTYSGLVDNLAEGVAILDEDARFIYVNPACGQIFGMEPEQLLGRATVDLVAPGSRARHREELRNRVKGQKSAYEMEILRPDGGRRWVAVRAAPRKDVHGRFAGAVASFFDISDHREALEALGQSETRFRRLVEMLPQGLVTYKDGLIVYANPAATSITRQDPAAVVGMPIAGFIRSDFHGLLRERLGRIVRGEQLPSFDYTFLRGDGTEFQAEAYGMLLEQGERPLMVSVFTDLTHRLEMERTIHDQDDLLRVISDQTGQLIYDYDLSSGHIRWTGPMRAMLGLPKDSLTMDIMEWTRLLHPDDFEREAGKLQKSIDAMRPVYTEYRVRRADGSYIPVEDHGVFLPGPDGKAARMVGIIRDIRGRYAAEQAMRESEERYRSVIEQAQDMIYIVDLDTRAITEANRSFFTTLGYKPADLKGLTLYALVDADKESVDRNIALVQRVRSQPIGHRRYKHADGSVLDAEVSASICRAGGHEFMVVLARDITERLASEQAMQQSQKLESLGVLAGGIAHDFNNLLTAMMGNLSLAQLRSHPSSPSWPYLDALEKSLHRAADLTRQMLAYSGKGRFVTKVLDLNHTVEEMTHLLSVSISKRAVLRFDLEKGLPPLEADPGQLQQVIMNLVINASDAIGEREGVIRVTTGLVELSREDIQHDFPAQAVEPGPHLLLEVEDTGCGMDETTQARIFEPFFTTKATGRGLGLSAMLGILRGHHAGIRIRSSQNEGTTFSIYLPAKEGAQIDEAAAGSALAVQPTGAALVVDDEEEIRSSAVEIFEVLGFQSVIPAKDGAEALEIFEARRGEIALVFMDLTMPRMNGRDAFRAMRALDPGIPVILTSGYAEEETPEGAERPSAFIQKPYRVRHLRETVMAVLREQGHHR